MIEIDGGMGEGGGQVLRSSLSLSLITGEPFRIRRIRCNRKRGGLLAQHLTAVRAAAAVGRAEVSGDRKGSGALTFSPGAAEGGEYTFDVGTAGSASLVLQTVLPALLQADQPSKITVSGGTHNGQAPPFHFLKSSFAPQLRAMGVTVKVRLQRYGFFPRGGGRITAEVTPTRKLVPLRLLERGAQVRRLAVAAVAGLPAHIAERELAVLGREPGWSEEDLRQLELPADQGPGNVAWVELAFEQVCEVVTGFGRKGVPAGRVAGGVVHAMRRYLDSGAVVGEHLADQLLLPMALAGGGVMSTVKPSPHSTTNMEVIGLFLPVRFRVDKQDKNRYLVRAEAG